jgi:hypothetical protein
MAVLGTVIVIAVIAALVTPKTAHAVVATMVDVVNTSANPAATLDNTKAASQILELICPDTAPGEHFACEIQNADNGVSAFTVPGGQTFIITSVDVIPFTPAAGIIDLLLRQNGSGRERWYVPGTNTTLLQFPTSGIPISSGSTLSLTVVLDSSTGAALRIHGYLTSN